VQRHTSAVLLGGLLCACFSDHGLFCLVRSTRTHTYIHTHQTTFSHTHILAFTGPISDIHWLTDKETGKFFGSGFLEFSTPEAASKAVAKAGEELLGRAVKIDFAKPKAEKGAGGGGGKGGGKTFPMSEKPEVRSPFLPHPIHRHHHHHRHPIHRYPIHRHRHRRRHRHR